MNWSAWKLGLLQYFASVVNTTYSSSDIDSNDRLILLRSEAEAGQADKLIKISDLVASFANEYAYIIFDDTDPESLGTPDADKYYFGVYNSFPWIKTDAGIINWLYAQILEKEVASGGSNIVDFTPIKIPLNTKVERNRASVNVASYTISGTRIIFDNNLNQYEIVHAYIPYTILP